MQKELQDLQPILEKTSEEVEEMMVVITNDKKEAGEWRECKVNEGPESFKKKSYPQLFNRPIAKCIGGQDKKAEPEDTQWPDMLQPALWCVQCVFGPPL